MNDKWWTEKTIRVLLNDGTWVEVKADVVGKYAIHDAIDNPFYCVVTHIGLGMTVAHHLMSRVKALYLAHDLDAISDDPKDFTFVTWTEHTYSICSFEKERFAAWENNVKRLVEQYS